VIDLPGLLGLVLTIRYRQPLLLTQNIFTSLGDAPALVDGTALAYVLSRCVLRTRLPAILPALIAGLAIAALDGEFRQVPARLSLGTTLLVDGVAVIVKQRGFWNDQSDEGGTRGRCRSTPGMAALSVPSGGGPDVGARPRPPRAPIPRETTTATTVSVPSETVPGVSRGTNGWRPTSGQEKESNNRCAC
jgi:hypothetical protein